MCAAWLQHQVCDKTTQWGLWNWPDCVSGLAELLLLHQIGLIDYKEIRQSNLPARTLNAPQWVILGVFVCFFFFSHARVWLCFHGWQQATLAQMGAERRLAWRWKHKQRAGMQRVVQRVSFSSRVFAEQQQTHSCGRTQTEAPGETDWRVAKSAVNSSRRPRVPLGTRWNTFSSTLAFEKLKGLKMSI